MEKSNELETIRKACISANGSILDLKFGCEVEVDSSIGGRFLWLSKFHSKDLIFASQGDYGEAITLGGTKKIIGRPIRLFDIKQCLVYYGYTDVEWIEIVKLWIAPNDLNY